jgi:hypothetical protein
MQTFNTSHDLLKNWDSGQGKTVELADIASLTDNQLTYDGYTVEVTPVWQEAALVMYLHKELKTKPALKQRAALDLFAQNRLSDNHKFEGASKTVLDKPLPNHYLSSVDLQSNYFALTEADTVASVYHLLAEVNSSLTKETILNFISSAKELIISAEQAQTLSILEAKESALVEVRTKLEEIGCIDVKFTSETTLSAVVDFILVSKLKAIKGLLYDNSKSKLLPDEQLLVNLELVSYD